MFLYLKAKHHFTTYFIATTFWTYYFLGGLWSEYYQTWPFLKTLIIVDIIPLFMVIYFGKAFLKPFTKGLEGNQIIIASIAMALHFTIPYHIYDFIYIYLHLNKGISYLYDYWYLTFFSLIPLIVFPIMAFRLKKKIAANAT